MRQTIDIVERLRSDRGAGAVHWNDCAEAASVIEKLRNALKAADKMRDGIRRAGVKRMPEIYMSVMAFDAARAALSDDEACQ
jgi:hypothetical protein